MGTQVKRKFIWVVLKKRSKTLALWHASEKKD